MRGPACAGALALLLLGGCAGPVVVGCPPVRDYPDAFQQRAAGELAALPADAALRRLVDDYRVMRQQARACRGQ